MFANCIATWRPWHKYSAFRGLSQLERAETAHVEVSSAVLRDSASNCAVPCSPLLRVVWRSWDCYLGRVLLNRKSMGRERRGEARGMSLMPVLF